MVIREDNHRLLALIIFFDMGQIVWGEGLLLYQIPYILFIPQDFNNVAIRPFGVTSVGVIPGCLQFSGNGGSPLFFYAIFVENQPDQLCLVWIYC